MIRQNAEAPTNGAPPVPNRLAMNRLGPQKGPSGPPAKKTAEPAANGEDLAQNRLTAKKLAEEKARARTVARAQAVAACRALAEALLMVFVDEEARVDVLGRDVVLRVVRPLPHVDRANRVENHLAAQNGADTPRHGLEVVDGDDRPRVVVHGGDQAGGCGSPL